MNPYEDIMHLPHPISQKHPQMSMHARAAQFGSFAALHGHEEAIAETGRLTDQKIELDGDEREKLDQKLLQLCELLEEEENADIRLTHFIPDEKKTGGRYHTERVTVRKVDFDAKSFLLTENRSILVCNIYDFIILEKESDREA